MHVSISAYNDAELLDGCLHSVRDALGDVPITVVDGRYESWPEGADNSTDATAAVAADWDAAYDAAGPFEREVDKHRYRVDQLPSKQHALFLDADERVVTADVGALDPENAYAARIYNPVVYSESPVRYWPRYFPADDVLEVSRWDRYLFDAPCERTDRITIAHRHDLREREYREAKYQRFRNEGREGRYEDRIEQYLTDDWDVTTTECPNCGRESLARSPATNADGEYSEVAVCIAGDGCHAAVESVAVGEWRYLPDGWEAGLEDDPARLRLELLDAGCDWVAMHDFTTLRTGDRLDDMKPAIRLFVEDTFEREEPRVFGEAS